MIQGQTDSMELAEIMHALDMARRWALTIVPRAEDEVALEIHLKSIDAARAKLQAIMDEAVDACPQHAVTGLFEQIVRPALNDCGSLSLPDYRIIQGAVMQALCTAQRQNAADMDCPHTYRTGVGKWMICNECGERV